MFIKVKLKCMVKKSTVFYNSIILLKVSERRRSIVDYKTFALVYIY